MNVKPAGREEAEDEARRAQCSGRRAAGSQSHATRGGRGGEGRSGGDAAGHRGGHQTQAKGNRRAAVQASP